MKTSAKKSVSKEQALANYLEVPLTDAKGLMEDYDYKVLTDAEADAEAKEYILESAWAFKYSFLCNHSEAIAEIPEKNFTDMAGKLCESFNKAVLAMIPDKTHFVCDAISSDGRGHFLSQYDGEEIEQDGFYIYRCN